MKNGVVALCIILIFAGCSLDYSSAYVTEDMSADIPDSILFEFKHTSVKDGTPVFRLSAGTAYIYNKRNETTLSDILFQEFNRRGEIITEGRADEAVFFTDTENAEFWGDLYFYSLSEKASFQTPYLYWDNEEKKLVGREDSDVLIRRDSGTEILGTGFEAEARTRIVTFSGPVSGTYVLEDEDEEKPEE
ncbi:MAG: LPS export ABC transporter periplasmic protein LptC [Spirochaetales bacterium]|nr:LPS export ABC transporter periplasmic protein LptC [Spirochaetales bacterium]